MYQLLNKEQKQLLNSKKITVSKKKGTALYQEGDHASTFFMIRQGLLKHMKQVNQDEYFFTNYRQLGELTGLASLKRNTTYSTSAICLTDVVACAFPSYLIVPFIHSNHLVTEYFFDQFVANLRDAGEKIFSLIKCPAHNRLAQTLLFLNDYLQHDKNGMEIKREELAEYCNMTRETISRQLAKMKKANSLPLKTITSKYSIPPN